MAATTGQMVELLGTAAGSLGVCFAVYLQLVFKRKVKPRYVAGFYAVGAALLAFNSGAFVPYRVLADAVAAVAILCVIVAEIVAFFHVLRVSDRADTIREAVGDAAEDLAP